MKKRLILMLIALLIVFGGLVAYNEAGRYFLQKHFATYTPPPVTISAAVSQEKPWTPYLTAVGTFVSVNTVDVTSDVNGIVTTLLCKSGSIVNKGTSLFQLDDSAEKKELAHDEAELTLATSNYHRVKILYRKRANSESMLDDALAKVKKAKANVERLKIIIAKKTIRAPFAGKLGIREAHLGQYIKPGDPLIKLQSFNPLYLHFFLPEHDVNRIHIHQKVSVTADSAKQKNVIGQITAYHSEVHEKHRNLLVQATFKNNNNKLYPGMFARIKVILPKQHRVITVPQTAISYSLYGDSIFVIKDEGKDETGKPILRVYRQFVKTGERRNNEVAVTDGLQANQRVVTSGQLKLENGTRVVVAG